MKIGDKVVNKDPLLEPILGIGIEYKVTGILPNEKGEYNVHLEGHGQMLFSEASLTIIELEPPDPRTDILNKLNHWHDELIAAQNVDEPEDIEKCQRYMDFYLDKLLAIDPAIKNKFPEVTSKYNK